MTDNEKAEALMAQVVEEMKDWSPEMKEAGVRIAMMPHRAAIARLREAKTCTVRVEIPDEEGTFLTWRTSVVSGVADLAMAGFDRAEAKIRQALGLGGVAGLAGPAYPVTLHAAKTAADAGEHVAVLVADRQEQARAAHQLGPYSEASFLSCSYPSGGYLYVFRATQAPEVALGWDVDRVFVLHDGGWRWTQQLLRGLRRHDDAAERMHHVAGPGWWEAMEAGRTAATIRRQCEGG